MSEAVVDELEVVQVNEEDGHRPRVAVVAQHRLFEPIQQQGAVRQSSERVMEGHSGQLLGSTGVFEGERDALGDQLEVRAILGAEHIGALEHDPD